MSPELDQSLCDRYPLIFVERSMSSRESCMGRGIEGEDGWFSLIDDLCASLQQDSNLRVSDQVVAVQVKEKLGALRFYTHGVSNRQAALITDTELRSRQICEICGAPGTTTHARWIKTVCSFHAAKLLNDLGKPVPPV